MRTELIGPVSVQRLVPESDLDFEILAELYDLEVDLLRHELAALNEITDWGLKVPIMNQNGSFGVRLRIVHEGVEYKRDWMGRVVRSFAGREVAAVVVDDVAPQPVRRIHHAMLAWARRMIKVEAEPTLFSRRYRSGGPQEDLRAEIAASVGKRFILERPFPDEEVQPGVYLLEDFGWRIDCAASEPYSVSLYFRQHALGVPRDQAFPSLSDLDRKLAGNPEPVNSIWSGHRDNFTAWTAIEDCADPPVTTSVETLTTAE